jgi:hypothetical protein
LLDEAGIEVDALNLLTEPVKSETELGLAVLDGRILSLLSPGRRNRV